jgi:membrane-bound lytic murein transglycosylase F
LNKILFHRFYGRLILFLLAYLLLISPSDKLTQWQKIQEKGYLTWITRPSPLTYYTSLDGVVGLEYDILRRFCDSNDLELVVFEAESNSQLFSMLETHTIDLAGANLALTERRQNKYGATKHYDETFIRIVSSFRKPKIIISNGLSEYKGVVLHNSSYEKIALNLKQRHKANITSVKSKSLFELLQLVMSNKYDYTLADSNIVDIFGVYIPRMRIAQRLSDVNKLVFYVPTKSDDSLKTKLDTFIDLYKSEDKVVEYKEFLINTLPISKPADTVNFLKNYKNRWPLVKPLIYETAEKYDDISPILLGAISYQESHWNPKAVSPTLVKGLMMLTKDVAMEQDVTDRFDAQQSLIGGTEYLIKMKDKIPDRILEPDKTNFALAAYNIGYGNLEKARVITQRNGKDPDLWDDVKLFLPLLNDLEVNKADGKTAVRYVENIHVYQNILQWKEQL